MRYKNIIERIADRKYKSKYYSVSKSDAEYLHGCIDTVNSIADEKCPDVKKSTWWYGLINPVERRIKYIEDFDAMRWYDTYQKCIEDEKGYFNDTMERLAEIRAGIDKYATLYPQNKGNFAEFCENPSMFFVAEGILGHNSNYYFAYEIQPSEDKQSFKAFVHSDASSVGHKSTFSALDYVVRPMTREEFEHEFIISHLNHSGKRNIEKTIEYDNYIRNLFNNSEK